MSEHDVSVTKVTAYLRASRLRRVPPLRSARF